MKINRSQWLSLALVLAAFALTAILYPHLPQRVPVHWNLSGQANRYAAKPWGPFEIPLAMAAIYVLLLLVPAISPRGYRIDQFRRTFDVIRTAMMIFVFVVVAVADLAAIDRSLQTGRIIFAALGVFLAILGNYMGKITKNFFVGIRTPWTLANDEVWMRTHRLGGKLFMIAGLALVVCALAGFGGPALIGLVILASAIPVIYSYLLYRRIEGFKNDGGEGDGGASPSPGHRV